MYISLERIRKYSSHSIIAMTVIETRSAVMALFISRHFMQERKPYKRATRPRLRANMQAAINRAKSVDRMTK